MGFLDRLKLRLPFARAAVRAAPETIQAMDHPVLGRLTPDRAMLKVLVGRISYGARQIELRIYPDDASADETLALAVSAVSLIEQLDAKCRELIADEFLGGYNSDWRFGEQGSASGVFEPFEKPLLSKSEFCAKLDFKCVEATGTSMLAFWYGDGDMFWGHSLEATSFDGVSFGDTYVSMAG